MAQRGPPFDFDLNELPPEDDGASDASPVRAPEPTCEPSLRDLLPPLPQETLPSPQHEDSLAPPAPEPAAHDPLPAPAPASEHDALLPPVPSPSPSPHDPMPSPRDPPHLPSPVLDLEVPLSPLDDDDDYDEADLPPPPPLPPFGLPVAAAPARSSSSVDTPRELPFPPSPSRRGGRTSWEPFCDAARLSSPEDPARRGPSRAASGTAPPRRPRSYAPRDDGAISKQRRVDYYDEDAGSSRSGSRRSEPGSPRRYERSELASPPQYGPGGGRCAPAAHGPPGAPPRNRRRRRRRPQPEFQYPGPIQKQQQGRGWEQPPQGLRGQERPQVHQGHHGPRGPDVPKMGYSSCGPQELPKIGGGGGYHQHGREAPSLRPSSGANGGDGSSGGRQSPQRQPVNGGAYRQRKAPRGREHFPDRPYKYNPYARDGGAVDRSNGGSGQAWREPYERRRDSKQRTSGGGPSRGRPYYGD